MTDIIMLSLDYNLEVSTRLHNTVDCSVMFRQVKQKQKNTFSFMCFVFVSFCYQFVILCIILQLRVRKEVPYVGTPLLGIRTHRLGQISITAVNGYEILDMSLLPLYFCFPIHRMDATYHLSQCMVRINFSITDLQTFFSNGK